MDIRCYVSRQFTCSTNAIIVIAFVLHGTGSTWWVDRSDMRYGDDPRATASLLPVSWISTDAKPTDYFWSALVKEEKQNLDKARPSTLWPAEHCALCQSGYTALFVLCWVLARHGINCRYYLHIDHEACTRVEGRILLSACAD